MANSFMGQLAYMAICAASGLGLIAWASVTKVTARSISLFAVMLAALAAIAGMASFPTTQTKLVVWGGALVIDSASAMVGVLCALSAVGVLMVSSVTGGAVAAVNREWPGLVLLVTAASMLAACAADLPTLLVSVETAGLGMNALIALGRHPGRGAELAAKASVVGAAAMGLLAMGAALIYVGSGGGLTYQELAAGFAPSGPSALATIGFLMVLVAVLFRVGAAPFHLLLPDFFEGGPLPAVMLFVSGFRIAVLAAIARLLSAGFLHPAVTADGSGITAALALVASVSLLVGAVGALRQDGVRRMLGYLSIAQLGWILLALAAACAGVSGAGLAFGALSLASLVGLLSALAVTAYVPLQSEGKTFVDDWMGLGKQRPYLAASMSVAMLSLCGMPLTVGFLGFFTVTKAAVASTWLWSALACAALAHLVALFITLRFVVIMHGRHQVHAWEGDHKPAVAALLLVATASIILFGLVPDAWLAWANALSLRP